MSKQTFQDNITLHIGDVTNSCLFKRAFANLTIATPPLTILSNKSNAYFDYLDFSLLWLKNCYLWTYNRGYLVVISPFELVHNKIYPIHADLIKLAQQASWEYNTTIVWNKPNGYLITALLVFTKNSLKNQVFEKGIWKIKQIRNVKNELPVELVYKILKSFSVPDDLVFVPFAKTSILLSTSFLSRKVVGVVSTQNSANKIKAEIEKNYAFKI